MGLALNKNELKTPYVFQTQPALKGLKTLLDTNTEGWGLNGGVGMLLRPTDQLQMGLAYETPTEIDSRGSLTGNGSALVGGEYSESSTRVGGHWFGLMSSVHY